MQGSVFNWYYTIDATVSCYIQQSLQLYNILNYKEVTVYLNMSLDPYTHELCLKQDNRPFVLNSYFRGGYKVILLISVLNVQLCIQVLSECRLASNWGLNFHTIYERVVSSRCPSVVWQSVMLHASISISTLLCRVPKCGIPFI